MNTFPEELQARLHCSAVVAGFSVTRVEDAVPVARALLAGGIDVIELTLRTPVAMEAARVICQEVPEMLVGVGTILTPEQVRDVKAMGAAFGVSPGFNDRVVREAQAVGLPFAPGVCTPSELEAALELGCRVVKLFPAEASGGLKYLRSMAAPYRHLGVRFFPLGGLNEVNMQAYLEDELVMAIGGSWIVQSTLVDRKDWPGITSRAASVRESVNSFRHGNSTRMEFSYV